MKKTDVIDLMRDMPDEIDADEVIDRLYLRQKLEAAERAAVAGDVISHDEVVKRSDEWLK